MFAPSANRPWTAIPTERSPAPPTRHCSASAMRQHGRSANGLNGMQLANPFAPDAILGEIDRTSTRSTTGGFSVQATNTDQLFGHGNSFVVGTSIDSSVSRFISQQRARDHRIQLCRERQRHLPWAIRLSRIDRPGVAAHDQPIYWRLCARHLRRHQGVLDHGRRPLQRCAHRAGGPNRHPQLNSNSKP